MSSIAVNIDPAGQVEMQFLTCSAMLPDKPGLYFLSPLKDAGQIRNAIKESHSLFEATHPMFQGVRNVNLFTLAFFFRVEGIPENVATDYLVAYYVDPAGGFSADEIKRTVKSAYSR